MMVCVYKMFTDIRLEVDTHLSLLHTVEYPRVIVIISLPVNLYSVVYSLSQLLALPLSPLLGIIMDWKRRKCIGENSQFKFIALGLFR